MKKFLQFFKILKLNINLLSILLLQFTLLGCGGNSSSTPSSASILPSLSISDANSIEGNSGTIMLEFIIELSAISQSNVSVQWLTSDITATAGSDYESSSGTATITAGQRSVDIFVNINGDLSDESDETFEVQLSNVVNATIEDGKAVGTITNDDITPIFGLDNRPDNKTCIAPNRPLPTTEIRTVEAFPNLPDVIYPTKMIMEPGSDPRWFVLEKQGRIVVFDPNNATALTNFMDINVRSNFEGGLLGMAFHPNYPTIPEIFISYTANHSDPSMRSVISRVILDDIKTPSAIGSGSVEQKILLVDQPFENHNGGDIAFGKDGLLYIGLGDGGGGGDPLNTGQDTTRLLGSFLRINVNGAGVNFPDIPYTIPSDNPFSEQPKCGPSYNSNNCPEIYAWGLRNPFRWSFDRPSGRLWAADVGQNSYEEVDIIRLGKNYGWRCREGANDYNVSGCNGPFEDPITEYGRSEGTSVTGGMVYRGSEIPGLIGSYIFADYGSGRIWALAENEKGDYTRTLLEDTPRGPTSFGMDQDGELYFTDINSGRLVKIERNGNVGSNTIPALLSDSGCVDPDNIKKPYSGLLPYNVNAPFWSDGADKDRFIGIPNETKITIDNNNDWEFPEGTVIVKNFRLRNKLIETRHLMKHPDGIWAGYTYQWNEEETEAMRVIGGKIANIEDVDWIFPSKAQCAQCHTPAAKFALGLETAQMNRDFTYPETGRTNNQLETIDHVMMFSSQLLDSPDILPALTDPADTTKSLENRARAYLHTNCASCHQPGGGTPVNLDLRYQTKLPDTWTCNVAPQSGDLGISNARIIEPGASVNSVLAERMNRRDTVAMPPIGSSLIDPNGIKLIRDWIDSLESCD